MLTQTIWDAISGAVGGAVGTVVTYPLDYVKIRRHLYGSANHAVLQSLRETISMSSIFMDVC